MGYLINSNCASNTARHSRNEIPVLLVSPVVEISLSSLGLYRKSKIESRETSNAKPRALRAAHFAFSHLPFASRRFLDRAFQSMLTA
jgi:hypothetical protein